jgi:nitrite reductase (NO-forming)
MPRMIRTVTIIAVVAVALAGCARGAAPGWTFAPGQPAASPGAQNAGHQPTPAPSAGAVAGVLEIEAWDLGFTPAEITVPTAGTYEVTLTNTGIAPHDVTFADGTTIAAAPGASATETVAIPDGGTTFICSVPGHEQGGMTGTVTVSGAPAASDDPDSHGGPAPSGDVAADPNAPDYELLDARAPARLDGDVHDIELVMTEEEKTIAPGFVQKVWTFGGQVPGPVIRVKVGDTVRITLKNPATNQLGHSIDFHSSQVAWNDEMTTIAPGEEKVYEWTADYAGVWMYHCGTSPALHHIANGMYGMVIVEPEGGLPAVDHEFAIVQSEWYLGPQGKEADLSKAMAAAPAPDLVLLNGVANQYLDHPLEVATGARVRIYVLNAGPSVDSSFHVVGTIFDSVVKEGVELARGNDGSWGSQAVDLSPAQGAIVEFTTAEDGLYPMVTHAFNFVGRGALGLIQAGDGDPAN